MTINKTVEGNCLTLAPVGRLDTLTAPMLEEELDGIAAPIESLILELSALEYISSAGLRVILKAQKLMKETGGLTVRGANATVMEVFEITGFSDILNII